MSQHPDRQVDEDRKKGAVENVPDGGNVATHQEQGVSNEPIEVTENAIGANKDQVKNAEHILGADEDGTPG